MLEVRLPNDGRQRFSDCAARVEEVAECLRRVAVFGAYSRSAVFDVSEATVAVVDSPAEGLLEIQSPLFAASPASLRHLATAIRYQCLSKDVPVSFSVERTHFAADATTSPLLMLATDFGLDLHWWHKRLSLHIDFHSEIEPTRADAIDVRVRAWAAFSRQGAFCSQEQLSNPSEDFEPGIEVDLPTVGCDWVEWSLTVFDVPQEALAVLINEIAVFDCPQRQISSLLVG